MRVSFFFTSPDLFTKLFHPKAIRNIANDMKKAPPNIASMTGISIENRFQNHNSLGSFPM